MDDPDWTKSPSGGNEDLYEARRKEYRLRDECNLMIKAQLQAGRSVQYTSSGWSLYPQVNSSDCCLYEPVNNPKDLCEVRKLTIYNASDYEDGFWYDCHIYGRLIETLYYY